MYKISMAPIYLDFLNTEQSKIIYIAYQKMDLKKLKVWANWREGHSGEGLANLREGDLRICLMNELLGLSCEEGNQGFGSRG